MATLAISLAGAAIGGATLGTGVVAFGLTGTAIGWTVGSIVGGMLFPPPDVHQQGPRLEDQKVSSSAYGQMIPIAYGTVAVAGNIIDASGYYETSHTTTQSGGKGGGQEVSNTTYTYSIDLAVALCEGPIDGIQQIYANEQLIYDRRSTSDISRKSWLQIKEYLGTEIQEPDPTLEALHTDVPAYRGLAYVVFTRFELQEFGNRPPNFRFVVVNNGTSTVSENIIDYDRSTTGHVYNPTNGLLYATLYNDGGSTATAYQVPTLSAIDPLSKTVLWSAGSWDGSFGVKNVKDPVVCGYINTDIPPKTKANSLIIAEGIQIGGGFRIGIWDANTGACLDVKNNEYGFQVSPGGYFQAPYPDANILYFELSKTLGGGQYRSFGRVDWGYVGTAASKRSVRLTLPSGMTRQSGGSIDRIGCKQGSITTGISAYLGFALLSSAGSNAYFGIIEDNVPDVLNYYDLSDPDEPWPVKWLSNTYIDASPWNIIKVEYDSVSDSWWLLMSNESVTQEPRWVNVDMSGVILGDYDWATDYGFSTSLKATAGNNWQGIDVEGGYIWMELANGKMYQWDIRALTEPVEFDGSTISSKYTYIAATDSLWGDVDDDVVEWNWNRLDSNTVTLASIVDDLCDRVGIDSGDYDTTELASTDVRGYLVSRVNSARSAIEPLRRGFLFDAGDTGSSIEFRNLGQTLDRSLDADDAGAHTEGEEMPPLIIIHREQEVSLPSEMMINYLDEGANYEIGTQLAKRQASKSVQKTPLNLPIVFTHGEAAQQADILLHIAHIEREHYECRLMPVHSDLIPSDVIIVNDGTTDFRMRVIEKIFENGYIRVRGVRDEASVLTSAVAGAEITDRDTEIALRGIMQTWILNLPALRDEDNTAGFYAVGFSYSPGWPGGVLLRYINSVWGKVGGIANEATVGFCNNAFDAGDLNRWDYSDELEINIVAGDDPVSDTEENVLNGANVAAWGDQGRYEIIQWVAATQELDGSYTLSQLLRGRMGTEQYTDDHANRDKFIILDEDTLRKFTMQNSEIGDTNSYKGVTLGINIYDESIIEQDFTHDGRALKPWAPIHVDGYRDGVGDLIVTWDRRDKKIARPFWDPEVSESAESYEIDVLDSGTPTAGSPYTVTSETWTYEIADQITDFGSPVPANVDIIIYQISSVVDRGFGAEATL